ncbi:MAG: HNH endonuclease [Chloroflexi bacterium]|nr:HNH endonuclease [Chloroflexota bacterium]
MADRAEHTCEYCLAPEELSGKEFEVEHIIPRADGGSDDLDNLALACRRCNGAKLQARVGTDPDTGEEVSIFNPRTDDWDAYFEFVDLGAGRRIEIRGRNTIRRATAERLNMNAPHAARARWHWFTYYRLATRA